LLLKIQECKKEVRKKKNEINNIEDEADCSDILETYAFTEDNKENSMN